MKISLSHKITHPNLKIFLAKNLTIRITKKYSFLYKSSRNKNKNLQLSRFKAKKKLEYYLHELIHSHSFKLHFSATIELKIRKANLRNNFRKQKAIYRLKLRKKRCLLMTDYKMLT